MAQAVALTHNHRGESSPTQLEGYSVIVIRGESKESVYDHHMRLRLVSITHQINQGPSKLQPRSASGGLEREDGEIRESSEEEANGN